MFRFFKGRILNNIHRNPSEPGISNITLNGGFPVFIFAKKLKNGEKKKKYFSISKICGNSYKKD
jgi:hypothetical protein